MRGLGEVFCGNMEILCFAQDSGAFGGGWPVLYARLKRDVLWEYGDFVLCAGHKVEYFICEKGLSRVRISGARGSASLVACGKQKRAFKWTKRLSAVHLKASDDM